MALLDATGLVKAYVSPEGATADVLKGVDLSVSAGETVSISGPSGCGKSTLLNILATLDRPTSGRVTLDGRDVLSLDEAALAQMRSSTVGLVFQAHHLLPQCSVLENVLVPAAAARNGDGERRARTLLDRVGLGARLAHRPGQLSGGECQRAAVVRALVNKPKLLLADEPTGSLDRGNADALASLLLELNREEGTALILVTHSPELAARAGRALTLRDGLLK